MAATARTSSSCAWPAPATRRSRGPAAASSRPCGRRARRPRTSWSPAALPRVDALIAEGVTTLEIKSGYGLERASEMKSLRAARRLGEMRPLSVTDDVPRRPRAAARSQRRQGRLYRPRLPTTCCRPSPPPAWPMRSTPSARASPSRRNRSRACSRPPRRTACRVKLHAEQLSNLHGAAWRPVTARCRPITWNISTRQASPRWPQAGTVAVLLPGAFYFVRETHKPPVELLRRHGVPIALASDSNPGTSPLTSLLLAMNMARDAVPAHGRRMPGRCHPRGGAGAGLPRQRRHARGGQVLRSRDLGHRASRPSWSTGWASIRCTHASGGANEGDRTYARHGSSFGLARHLSRRDGEPRSGRLRGHRGVGAARSRPSSRRASRSTASTPASESWPASASRPPTSQTLQRNIVLSACRRRRRADAGARGAPDDGAEARQPGAGRVGRTAGDGAAAGNAAGRGPDTRRALPGLGRCLGRSRAARPHDVRR